MPTTVTPTTELDAVNAILRTIGESPVVSLLGTLPVDAGSARNLLHEESRRLQKTGWSFNTEFNFELTPDDSGNLNLPTNTLKVDAPDHPDLVQRGQRLYDNVKHSYAFDKAVKVDLVIALPFDELPETVRHYLLIASGRRFQDAYLGDGELHSFTARDEMRAWSEFLSDEADVSDLNVLTSKTSSRIIRRGR